MIPQKTVQEILETAKVEDVVQDFVNLRRRGVNMIGLCPFHHEKTPSFTVSPTKNLFKCFGCGKGGDPARFIMEHENLSFPDALKYLARKYRIEIEEVELTPEMAAAQQEEESLYIVNEYARQFFEDQLFKTDIGKSVGLNYFKERGFREETIKKFGLGFAPKEGDVFTQKATQAGYKLDYLKKLGLTSRYDKDFFRNRVMFTIHNLSGKPIAFAGRIMEKDPKAPKYINSPETDVYVKNKILYGAFHAKKAIRQLDECILVEGYTDVISLHQAGIENVVASSGTSLTEGQISLIKRFTPNIKILYDGDPAGVKAALRGLDMVLEKDMNVKVVLIPDKEDPDSYLQKIGATAFQEFIGQQAQDFILFKTNLLLGEVKGDPVKKAGLVRDIVDSIARVPDPFKRSFYVKECARVMELEEEVLVSETNKAVRQVLQKKQFERQKEQGTQLSIVPEDGQGNPLPDLEVLPPQPARPTAAGHEFQERDIVRILIEAGSQIYDEKENITVAEFILSNIEEVLEDFDNKLYQQVARECHNMVVAHETLSPQYFIGHTDPNISELAVDLLHSPFEYSPGWEERDLYLTSQKMPEQNFTRDSLSSLRQFKLRKIIRLCEKNQERLKELKDGGDMGQLMRLLKVQTRLHEMRNELAKELGTVVLK
ncbi:MAG: DNA primase [Lewinellaceae bacterium]|nr:DNA primase [Saprospiraceae bacterium]MCB9336743.1 DNA primase [Lewinellaceae bacterium]